VLEALLLGGLAQSSLVLSGLFASYVAVPRHIVGWLAGFGAGALISAVTFDLTVEAAVLGGVELSLWLLLGAATYLLGDWVVERRAQAPATADASGDAASDESGQALGIVVGAVVDGVPESLIFGIGVAAGDPISVSFLAAVMVSNVPESLAPSAELAAAGWSRVKLVVMWGSVMVAGALASGVGYLIGSLTGSGGEWAAAFAAGGLLAMLADSLMPFAYERGRNLTGAFTVLGFALAVAPRTI
jgi:ZIP family zinc transporter